MCSFLNFKSRFIKNNKEKEENVQKIDGLKYKKPSIIQTQKM